MDDSDPFEGVFDGEQPEDNGDATPQGDIDSEAAVEPVEDDSDEDGVDPSDDVEGAETDAEEPSEGDEPEWLVEGRFKKDQVDDLAEAYRNLESFASRRENELREQIKAEREAAFEEARRMMELNQQQQKDPVQEGLQKHQQYEQAKWLALQDPGQAWQVAQQAQDPRLAQTVIDTIRNGDEDLGVPGDPNLASMLGRELVQMQSQNEMQRMRQEFQEFKQQQAVEGAWNQISQEYAGVLAEDSPIRQEIAVSLQQEMERDQQMLQQTGRSLYDFTNPSEVRQVFERAVHSAIGRAYRSGALTPPGVDSTAQQETPKQEQPSRGEVKRKGTLESGTPNRGGRRETKSPAEEFADEIFAAAMEDAPHKFR